MFLLDDAKTKQNPETSSKNDSMNFNCGFMGLRRKKKYLKNYVMSGREKTVKTTARLWM